MGAPDFAVPALDALVDLGVEQGVEIVAVYTRTPKPGGRRGLELTRTAVHQRAEALGLRVLTPTSLRNAEAQAEFAALAPDAAVVAAYGLILPPEILATPRLGCVNLHGSLLPRWRGAAPIQRAIMAGDAETGVGLMRMEAGLDTGPVAREARMRIRPEHTAGDLTKTLAQMSGQLLRECWSEFAAGTLAFAPQSDVGVEYAKKIDKRETPIDWSRDAVAVRNHIHGLSPSPGAYSEIANQVPARRGREREWSPRRDPRRGFHRGLRLGRDPGAGSPARGQGADARRRYPARRQAGGRRLLHPRDDASSVCVINRFISSLAASA